MSREKKVQERAERRTFRTRNHVKRSNRSNRLRVSVFRSSRSIAAQIIDDATHTTVASSSSYVLKDLTGDKKAIAHAVGVDLGKKAAEKSITQVCFDRGQNLYHGRVKALADGLRESGLEF